MSLVISQQVVSSTLYNTEEYPNVSESVSVKLAVLRTKQTDRSPNVYASFADSRTMYDTDRAPDAYVSISFTLYDTDRDQNVGKL